jgi:lysophospholipase L1-like esterase
LSRVRAHFGLEQPYRFGRVLVLLATLALSLVVLAAVLFLWSRGGRADRGISWGTPRSWYFVYLTALLALTLLLARWPRKALAVLSLASLEIGLGFGSALLYIAHLTIANPLFPNNYHRPLYDWHPLLQAVPKPTPPAEAATTKVHITAERLRGRDRTPQELQGKTVIALFGGSTTMDFSNPDGESWADRLEQKLGADRYAVINHGAPGYTTAEHVLQTAFYQRAFDTAPDCAIYYIGWNDLTNAHIPDLDPGYADYHLPGQIDFLGARRLDSPVLTISPVLRIVTRLLTLAVDTPRPVGTPPGRVQPGSDPKLEAIYRSNIHAISAINRERGIVTVWVGQVMNPYQSSSETMRGWLPFVTPDQMLPMIARFNRLLQREAAALGDRYIDVLASSFHDTDFIDEGHFSPAGALRFAHEIAPSVAEACVRTR